nr:isochorismatase family protein [Acuticoccus mangrovi]
MTNASALGETPRACGLRRAGRRRRAGPEAIAGDLRPLPADRVDRIPEATRQSHIVMKRIPGPPTNTQLDAHPRSLGATQVVIAGVAAGNGAEIITRQACARGLDVTPASGAMADMRADADASSIARIFPRIGATHDVLALS